MDKMKMHTPNLADENFKKLAALFPNAVTETIDENGNVVRAIDKDVLMQEISTVVVEGKQERYQFTWPNKKQTIVTANAPINKTLRPCREESIDFDNTENLYIEGDNLEVLKLLQETYLGKIKLIYIDPPYNTGNDFIYEDDFVQDTAEYLANSGQIDDEGNRLVKNIDSNGRFHTDWINMIYPRLRLAKDLLQETGVIFISIDDYEVENLRKCCDEIFGESNFIAQIVWERSYAPINLVKHFSKSHDYILCYAKDIDKAICNGLVRPDSTNSKYANPDNDPRGLWRTDNLSVGPAVAEKIYEIITPSGRKCMPPKGRCWLYTKERFEEMVADNRIWFGENGDNVPAPKRFLSEVKQGLTPMTIWKYTDVGHTQDSMRELRSLFDGEKVFDYSKPVKLMKQIVQLYTQENDIVLDFFSGSASTAHAVMEQNAIDNYNRKYIMVQLPELTSEKSDAYKLGYKTICDIGKDRIRRAGKKIKEDRNISIDVDKSQLLQRTLLDDGSFDDKYALKIQNPNEEAIENVDIGFRVLKLDSSNMKDVFYRPDDYSQDMFSMLEDNIKEDRSPEDLLFQVMLDLGILLSSKIVETEIAGKKVFDVADGYLIACFDSKVTEDTVTAIAKKKPDYAVFRDSGYATDSVATNFEQIFKTFSPETTRKVF